MERVKTIPVYTRRSSDFGSRKGGSGYGDVSSIGSGRGRMWTIGNTPTLTNKVISHSLMLTVRQAGRKIGLQSE